MKGMRQLSSNSRALAVAVAIAAAVLWRFRWRPCSGPVRHLLFPLVTRLLTSSRVVAWSRRRAEAKRARAARPHAIAVFYAPDDAHGHLLLQALRSIFARFERLTLDLRPVRSRDFAAYSTTADEQREWVRGDAQHVAQLYGLRTLPTAAAPPSGAACDAAAARAAALCGDADDVLSAAVDIGDRLCAGEEQPAAAATTALDDNARLLRKMGHYLPCVAHYEGEWYWGVDRLQHLERRLQDLGLLRDGVERAVEFTKHHELAFVDRPPARGALRAAAPVELWYSFRSPYSQLILRRLFALVDAFGAELKLRPILPMVTRGLAVPPAKRMYIVRDAAREGRLAAVHTPIGPFVDPLGAPTERAFAVFHHVAERRGRGREFLLAYADAVWCEGYDAGSDYGLRIVTERAGLQWAEARDALYGSGRDAWRDVAEQNRALLVARGMWGVPCVAVGDACVFGQDRLFAVERALAR